MADQPKHSPPKNSPPKKKSPSGGRVTPKGTRPGEPTPRWQASHPDSSDGHPGASSRYTPPVPLSDKITAVWVVPVMFVLLGGGLLLIVLNYMGLLPGGTDNWYLLGGLGLILGGILTATQLR